MTHFILPFVDEHSHKSNDHLILPYIVEHSHKLNDHLILPFIVEHSHKKSNDQVNMAMDMGGGSVGLVSPLLMGAPSPLQVCKNIHYMKNAS